MSTRSTLFYAEDDKGKECHIYWELGERIPGKAAPIYIEVEAENRQVIIRLPIEIAKQIREVLEPTKEGFSNLEVI